MIAREISLSTRPRITCNKMMKRSRLQFLLFYLSLEKSARGKFLAAGIRMGKNDALRGDKATTLFLTVQSFLAIYAVAMIGAGPRVEAVYEFYRDAAVSAKSPIAPTIVICSFAGGLFGAVVLIYDGRSRYLGGNARAPARPREN